jgi:phospholipase C
MHPRGGSLSVLIAGVLLVALSAAPTADARSPHPQPAAADLSTLQHLIFIVQENRSFDQYFGTYPGADGFPMTRSGKIKVCIPDHFLGRCVHPYHTTSKFQYGGPHDQRRSILDVNGGKMNGFVNVLPPNECWIHKHAPGCAGIVGPGGQPDVMSYHTRAEIPNYWAYAHHFELQDHLYASADSWTLPSHLYIMSGWAASCSDPSKPMSCTSNLSLTTKKTQFRYGEKPIYAWTDITYLLDKANVSWRYYVDDRTCIHPKTCKSGEGTTATMDPVPGFNDVHSDSQVSNVVGHSKFVTAATNGTLPSVSWIVPGPGYSEHPRLGGSLENGQAFVTKMINAVMRGPDWDTSAIFVSWDDWGGFYDNVRPPNIDANGYGIRVPGLVISPYSKAGTINSQKVSFDAYLKLIEDRFLGGQRLNPANDGRPDSRPDVRENLVPGDLVNCFDFTQTPLPPLILNPWPLK